MGENVDESQVRFVSRQLWRELLDHPTRAFDPEAAGLTLIAGGGEAAHQYAIRRWIQLRSSDLPETHTAMAVILAEAFDDPRALEHFATTTSEPYPEQLTRFDSALGPRSHVAKVFGDRILAGLRHYLENEQDLPFSLLSAAMRFRPDDQGSVYLPIRNAALARTTGTPSAVLGESFADRALEIAAAATPNRSEVLRTVLALWGMNFPAEEIPIEESRAGFAPTRWISTTHLISGINRPRIADVLIGLAMEYGYWRTPTTDATAFAVALGESCGGTASEALGVIAEAEVASSPAAVGALARRRSRLEAGTAQARERVLGVADALLSTGVIAALPADDVVAAAAQRVALQHSPADCAVAVELLIGATLAAPLRLMGQFEPPFVDAIAVATRLFGESVGFDHAFLEPTADQDGWILRYTRSGAPKTRELVSAGNALRVERLAGFLDEVTDSAECRDGRRLTIIDHDCLDAVVGFVDPAAWSTFLG